MSEVIEKLFQSELRLANKHLPIARKTLAQLLTEEIPYVFCRDGSIHVFKRNELQKLKNFVNNNEAEKLYLPIIIQIRTDTNSLIGFVEGELETTVIRRILQLKPSINDINKLVLHKPQIIELRYEFPTVFQIAIIIDLNSIDVAPSDTHSYMLT